MINFLTLLKFLFLFVFKDVLIVFHWLLLPIHGHPYLTCFYRGLLIGVLVLIVLIINHVRRTELFMPTLQQDVIFSLSVGATVSFVLLIFTIFWRWYQRYQQSKVSV